MGVTNTHNSLGVPDYQFLIKHASHTSMGVATSLWANLTCILSFSMPPTPMWA